MAGLLRLLAILQRFRPDVLHSHLFHANLLARAARLLWPAPVVISTLHSMAESRRSANGTRLRDLAYRVSDPMSDATVAVCGAVAERHVAAHAVPRRKIQVIPNGVDITLFRPDSALRAAWRERVGANDGFVWVAAGRLMWKKDYPSLLRAFAALGGGELLIAGTGPQEGELRALAGELKVGPRFLGRVEDMPGLLNAADGFVLSSVVEGLPVALIEAAACGLPAVTTSAGGAGEAVIDGSSGFVVPPGDSAALAGAMRRLCNMSPASRGEMGRRARQHAQERFDIGRVAERWDRLYRDLLERAD